MMHRLWAAFFGTDQRASSSYTANAVPVCVDRRKRTLGQQSADVCTTVPLNSKRRRLANYLPHSEPVVNRFGGPFDWSSFATEAERWVKTSPVTRRETVRSNDIVYIQPRQPAFDSTTVSMSSSPGANGQHRRHMNRDSPISGRLRLRLRNGGVPTPPLVDLTHDNGQPTPGSVELQEDEEVLLDDGPAQSDSATAAPLTNGDGGGGGRGWLSNSERRAPGHRQWDVLTDDDEDDEVAVVASSSALFGANAAADRLEPRFAQRGSLSPPERPHRRPLNEDGDDVQIIDDRFGAVDPTGRPNADDEVVFLGESPSKSPVRAPPQLRRWQRERSPPSSSSSMSMSHFDRASFDATPRNRRPYPVRTPQSAGPSVASGVDLEQRDRYCQLLKAMDTNAGTYRQVATTATIPAAASSRSSRSPRKSSDDASRRELVKSKMLLEELADTTRPLSPTPPVVQLDDEDNDIYVQRPSTSRSTQANADVSRSKPAVHDSQKVSDLNQRFAVNPSELCRDVYDNFLPGVERRKSDMAKQQIEVDLRAEARKNREKAIDDEIKLRLRLEGLILPEPEEEELEFPELTDEQNERIERALDGGSRDEILVDAFGTQIRRKDIRTLNGLEWLNDEVILFYMNLIVERSRLSGLSEDGGKRLPRVYAFNTFFYPKLMKDGHAGLKRWTRKIDLLGGYDVILVPVHLAVHWCLAVVDIRKKRISYYDSMGGDNYECLNALREYIKAESIEKKKPLNMDGWETFCLKDIPRQLNGSDCGMFACKFAEYVSRDAAITFTQAEMPYFRRRMVYEIVTKTLL